MEEEELLARLKKLAEEYEKDLETVKNDFTLQLAKINQSVIGKKKSLTAKILRALRKTEKSYLDASTKLGKDTDVFVLGFLTPKDRNAGVRDEIISEYLEDPSKAPLLIAEKKIASTTIIDDEGNRVTKEKLDDNGNPIPLNSETGEELTEEWYSAIIGVIINEDNQISPLTYIWLNGDRANPKSPSCILNKDIIMQRIKGSIYQSESGSLNFDRSDITIYPSTLESQREAAEFLLGSESLKGNITPLAQIQQWFDNSERVQSSKTGTVYGRDICITTGMVKSVFTGNASVSSNIKIIDENMPPELKRRGITVWIPNELSDIDVGSGDDVIIVGKVTQRTTVYNRDTKTAEPAPDGKGDMSISALSLFVIWPDEENESPEPVPKESLESELSPPRKFTADDI